MGEPVERHEPQRRVRRARPRRRHCPGDGGQRGVGPHPFGQWLQDGDRTVRGPPAQHRTGSAGVPGRSGAVTEHEDHPAGRRVDQLGRAAQRTPARGRDDRRAATTGGLQPPRRHVPEHAGLHQEAVQLPLRRSPHPHRVAGVHDQGRVQPALRHAAHDRCPGPGAGRLVGDQPGGGALVEHQRAARRHATVQWAQRALQWQALIDDRGRGYRHLARAPAGEQGRWRWIKRGPFGHGRSLRGRLLPTRLRRRLRVRVRWWRWRRVGSGNRLRRRPDGIRRVPGAVGGDCRLGGSQVAGQPQRVRHAEHGRLDAGGVQDAMQAFDAHR